MGQGIIIVITCGLVLAVLRLPLKWAVGVVVETTFTSMLISGNDVSTILLIILILRLVISEPNRKIMFSSRFLRSYGLYFVWALLSLIWVENWSFGFDTVKTYIRILFALAAAVAIIQEEADLIGIIWGIIFGIFYVSFMLLLSKLGMQTLATDVYVGRTDRLTVENASPNILATQVAWGVTLVVYYFRKIRNQHPKLAIAAIGILLVLSWVTVILTGSRTAMICSVAGPTLVLISSIPRKMTVILGIVMICFIGLWFLAPARSSSSEPLVIHLPFASNATDVRVAAALSGIDDTGRIKLLQTGILIGLDHPFFGVGIGNAKEFYPRYSFKVWQDPYAPAKRTLHNCFVTVFSETGFPGLLLFLYFLGAWVGSKRQWNHHYQASIFIFGVLFLITAMTTDLEQTTILMFLFGCIHQLSIFNPATKTVSFPSVTINRMLPKMPLMK